MNDDDITAPQGAFEIAYTILAFLVILAALGLGTWGLIWHGSARAAAGALLGSLLAFMLWGSEMEMRGRQRRWAKWDKEWAEDRKRWDQHWAEWEKRMRDTP